MAMANRSMEKWLAVPAYLVIAQIEGFCIFRVLSNGYFGWHGRVQRAHGACLDGRLVGLGGFESKHGRNMLKYVFWKR